MNGIGARIREARVSQQKSLSEIASRAKISAATLSRIETEKQGVGISLFLLLAKILKVHASELLGGAEGENGNDPLVQKLAAMNAGERAQMWHQLSSIRHERRTNSRESRNANMSAQIEELLAQIDYLRQQVDAMRSRMPLRKARR